MLQQIWVKESRKSIICVDSYEDGVLKGWFYDAYQQIQRFSSLSQFLLKMERELDDMQMPQSYTALRRYPTLVQETGPELGLPCGRGAKATFELKVLFRQHSSWQGVLLWREQKLEHSFRSVLELVVLLDSALRSVEGRRAG